MVRGAKALKKTKSDKSKKVDMSDKTNHKSGRKNHKLIFAIILVAAFLFIMSGSIYAFLFPEYRPQTFVKNQTLDTDENSLFTYEINRYPTSVQISNVTEKNITIGFALDPGSINFGIVPTGGNSGKRFITLQNIADNPSKIMLYAYGNISEMVVFNDNNFLLSKESPKSIEIILQTENGTKLGNYSGEIDIIVKKPKNSFAARLV